MAQDPLKIATQGMPGPAVNQQSGQDIASPVTNRKPPPRFTGQGKGRPLTGLEGTSNIGGKPQVPNPPRTPLTIGRGPARDAIDAANAAPPDYERATSGNFQGLTNALRSVGFEYNAREPQQPRQPGQGANPFSAARRYAMTQTGTNPMTDEQYNARYPRAGEGSTARTSQPSNSITGGLPPVGDLNRAEVNQQLISRADENNLTTTMGADGRVTVGGLRKPDEPPQTGDGETSRMYGDTEVTEYTGANGERAFTNLPQGQRGSFVANANPSETSADYVSRMNAATDTWSSMGSSGGGGGLPRMQRALANRVANINSDSSIGEIRAAQGAGQLLKQLQGNDVDQQNAASARMQAQASLRPDGIDPVQQQRLQLDQQEFAYQRQQDMLTRMQEAGEIVGVEKVTNPATNMEESYVRTNQGLYPVNQFMQMQMQRELDALEAQQGGR